MDKVEENKNKVRKAVDECMKAVENFLEIPTDHITPEMDKRMGSDEAYIALMVDRLKEIGRLWDELTRETKRQVSN